MNFLNSKLPVVENSEKISKSAEKEYDKFDTENQKATFGARNLGENG